MEILKIYNLDVIKKMNKEIKSKKSNRYETARKIAETWLKEILPKLNKSKLPVANIGGYDLAFFTVWNKFVKGKKVSEREFNLMVSELEGVLSDAAIFIRLGSNKKQFTNDIKSQFRIRRTECRKTGTYLTVSFDDKFNFMFDQFEAKTIILDDGSKAYGGNFVPLKVNKFKNKIYEKILTFESGNLIINDWFRTNNDEFSNITDLEDGESLNYTSGRVNRISHYADLNFASVNVGNSSPRVYTKGNSILVGRGPDLKKGKIYRGRVCTDLWNATIIDEKQFLKMLVDNGMTPAKAKKELAAQKKIWTCIKLKVKPGKYKLSFCGDYEDFSKKSKKKFPKGYKPYFTLERIGNLK